MLFFLPSFCLLFLMPRLGWSVAISARDDGGFGIVVFLVFGVLKCT